MTKFVNKYKAKQRTSNLLFLKKTINPGIDKIDKAKLGKKLKKLKYFG